MAGLIGPGKIVSLKSVTILKVDPITFNIAETFILLNAAFQTPDRVRFDAATNQQHNISLTPTRNPVERGVDITDHVKRNPFKFSVSGILTDTPLGLLASIQAAATPFSRRSVDQYRELEKMALNKELLFVATSLRFYVNLLITSISTPRNSSTGNAVRTTVSFEEIRIVGPALGAPVLDLDAILNGSGSTDIAAGGTQVANAFGG